MAAQDADRLLAVLDPDPQRAAVLYHELRHKLIRFVSRNGCASPEDVAQEAMVRGFRRLLEGTEITAANRHSYFFGIARNLVKEGWRGRGHESLDQAAWEKVPSADRTIEGVEARLTLARCLRGLAKHDRELLIRYHTGDAEDRRGLARENGITLDNLRVRIHRLSRHVRWHSVVSQGDEDTERAPDEKC